MSQNWFYLFFYWNSWKFRGGPVTVKYTSYDTLYKMNEI